MGETVLTAAIILSVLAIIFGTILAIAYRFLKVEEDPRIDTLEEMLPGTNCGACGTPGCRAFGESLLVGENIPAQCTVGSPEEIGSIAHFLGVDAGSVEKIVARLHCAGGEGFVHRLAEYKGIKSCRGAALVNSGGRACVWGCLGLGDCEVVCDFDAIRMNDEALPVVDVDKCTACNDCVEVCPLDLFTLEPLSQKLLVQCNTPQTGEAARIACAVACDACGRCVLDAPDGVLEMKNGLPVILEPDKTNINATFRCPTGAIQWLEGGQFAVGEGMAYVQTAGETIEV